LPASTTAAAALQQPQHPHRLLQILRDRGSSAALRRRQRVRQGVDDPVAQPTVAGMAMAGGAAQLRTHQRQRQLPGQKLVIGEPRPERRLGENVGHVLREMDAPECVLDGGKVAAADHVSRDPLRQFR
jgi:hypothetical protein